MIWVRWCAVLSVAISVAGCKVGPDYRQPRVKLPGGFAEATTRPTTQPVQLSAWWAAFDDPALDSLIQRAVRSNHDLKIAAHRVREARAARGIARAGFWPNANASSAYQRSRMSLNTPIGAIAGGGSAGAGPGAGAPFSFPGVELDNWQAGFDASWELDLFGGVRRGIEAAEADVAAAHENHRDVLVTLTAEVARNYIELRGLQQQLAIAEQNLAAQRQTVNLTQQKLKAGISGELDVTRAKAQVASMEASLPVLHTAIKRSLHRLGVLLGQDPNALVDELARAEPIPSGPAVVPPGLPSELLRRRPDIRRVERQLAAATARIGVATADLYPRFSLTGQFGFQSDSFNNWFSWDSRTWAFGPTLRWSIFNAGRVRSNIQVQNARQAAALEQYHQSILLAVSEVEDALAAFYDKQARRAALAAAVDANRRAVELARISYDAGLSDLLVVLDAQRSLYASEDQLIQCQSAVAADLVALFKALGGGWEESPMKKSPP